VTPPAASPEPILRVEGLTRAFGGLRAVDDCTLTVAEGTVSALIGPNGAGKTTLFNLLTGFLAPDRGRVLFRGRDITGLRPHQVFRRGICRTFQIPREFRDLTVRENLMVVPPDQTGESLWTPWLCPRAVRREEARIGEQADRTLAFVGLAGQAAVPAWTLSGGQKKLLELARALMVDPALLLLDEPGAGVNPTQLRELAAFIRRLPAERGVTVLLIEHDMDLVMRICDPVIVMTAGRILVEGPPDAVRRDPRVLEAYLGGGQARSA
jgi:branched-chain amino acid transport system ATP-binding protein